MHQCHVILDISKQISVNIIHFCRLFWEELWGRQKKYMENVCISSNSTHAPKFYSIHIKSTITTQKKRASQHEIL